MRATNHRWLRRGALLTGIVLSGWVAVSAQAMLTRSDALTCSNQRRDQVDARIAACTNMIDSKRLKGQQLGVAYALRGLAYLDRGDAPHAIGDLNRAIALAPDFVPAYQNRGNAWYARGNYGEALEDYNTAIRLDPKAASAYVNRATVRRDLGVIDGALEDYQQAINLGAQAPVYSSRGGLYMRQQNYAAAIADFDRAVGLDPSIGSYMLRAKAREADGQLDKALADYQHAARLASRSAPRSAPRYDPENTSTGASKNASNTRLIDALTAQAGVWRKKHDFDKAITLYNKAVLADQNRASTYALRAEAYMAAGDDKRAMADIGRALKFSWRAGFLKTRGKLRLKTGDIAGAIHDADAMLKFDPDDSAAYALRGAALVGKKDYARALPDLDRAIKTDDKNALAYAARGHAYFAKRETDRALADFNRAIELDAKNADLYRARAAIHKNKGDTDAAIGDLTEAIRRGAKPADFFQRASLYKAKGETDKVLRNLDAGLQRDPDNLDALRLRAGIERETGDLNGAIADYSAALKRDPKDVASLRARAEARIAAEDTTGAIADFDTLVKLAPRDFKARYQRGTLFEQNGDLVKAIDDYQTVLRHGGRFKEASVALRRAKLAQRKASEEAERAVREKSTRETAKLAAEKAARRAALQKAQKAQATNEQTATLPIARRANVSRPTAAAAIPEIPPSRTAPENSSDIVATPLPRARPRAPTVREARQTPAPEATSAAPVRSATPLPEPRSQVGSQQRRDDRRAAIERYRQRQAERARQRRAAEIRRYRAEQARHYRAAQARRRQPRYYRAGAYDVRRTRNGYELRRRRATFEDAFR